MNGATKEGVDLTEILASLAALCARVMGSMDFNPGLRLLRSLTPGYHISPLRGFEMEGNVFYKPTINSTQGVRSF